jgi:hypothetical protein
MVFYLSGGYPSILVSQWLRFEFPEFSSIYQALVSPKSFGHISNYTAGQDDIFRTKPHHKAHEIWSQKLRGKDYLADINRGGRVI